MTSTRRELLTARGYPPEIIAGHNGNQPAPVQPLEAGPACAVCGESLSAERLRRRPTSKTCGDACSKELARRTKRARQARYTPPHRRPEHAPPSARSDRLVEVVWALAGAGLSISVEIDGAKILLG